MTDNTQEREAEYALLKPCPFCKNNPYHRISEEMLDADGEIEVLCIYNHCPISGIGIKKSVWQASRPLPAPAGDVVKLHKDDLLWLQTCLGEFPYRGGKPASVEAALDYISQAIAAIRDAGIGGSDAYCSR